MLRDESNKLFRIVAKITPKVDNYMPENTLYLGLLIATLSQGTLLVGAILTAKNSNKTANRLLSVIIGLFSYYTLIKILCSIELIRDYPHFTQTYRPIPFLVWVALYFYTKAMANPTFRFQRKDFVHLIPFGLYCLFLLPYFLADETSKLQTISAPVPTSYLIAVVSQTALLLIYLIFSAKVLREHQQRIKNIFSNLEKVKLDWLKHLLIAFGIIWSVAFIKAFFLAPHITDFIVPPIALCITIYAIGFYALKQPMIFKDVSYEVMEPAAAPGQPAPVPPAIDQPAKNGQSPKYEYSGLSPKELSEYGEKLIEYLETKKPYTANDLKLQDIADYFGLPSHQLSQIINTELKRNFYDLINSHRIEEAKRELIAPAKQHMTILAIAYEVGFNSKSAFNTAFKKYTQMTPSQYKESQLGS